MIKIRVITLFLALCAFAFSAKPNIAVLTVDGDATTQAEQRLMISDRIQMELLNSDQFRVLNRNKMNEILKEQGFQQTGSCNSAKCQVQIGQLLGVEKLVSGKVVDFSGTWALSLDYTDVASGEVEYSVATEVKGELVDVLTEGCPRISQLLLERINAQNLPTTVPPIIPSKPINKKWIISGALFAIGVAGGITSYLLDQKIKDERKPYDSITKEHTQTEIDEFARQADDADKKYLTNRNIALGVGIAGLLGSVSVSIWF